MFVRLGLVPCRLMATLKGLPYVGLSTGNKEVKEGPLLHKAKFIKNN